MSVFVSEETFDLVIYMLPRYAGSVLLSVDILPDDSIPDTQTVTCKCKGRDAATMSTVMENATIINHVTGEPMVRVSVLYPQVILSFFTEWNLLAEDGSTTPITNHTVARLHDTVRKALAKKWLNMTGSKHYA